MRLDLAACLLAAAWLGPAARLGRPRLAWAVFAMAALALALDGVDGWLARRRRETSPFGARFDMVSDTFFTIVLTLCTLRFTALGPGVLSIGLLRPAFVAAGLARPSSPPLAAEPAAPGGRLRHSAPSPRAHAGTTAGTRRILARHRRHS
ncbi:MAG: CDP-alcohol phosphatidyltransferase family protein [Geminicoccaceae bacterium]